jgi:hypothetical protein
MHKTLKILLFFFVLGFSTLAFGKAVSEDSYNFKFIGLRFPAPAGWYVATDAEINQGMKEGAKLMGLDNPDAKAVVDQMPGKVLLMLTEHSLDSNSQNFNQNILVAAIDVRGARDEISTGAEYLRLVSQGVKKAQPNAEVSGVTNQWLGGEDFYKIEVTIPLEGINVYQWQLAKIRNDYLIVLNLSAENAGGMEMLRQITDRLSMSPVSNATDISPEGKSFRKQSSLNIASSSGGGKSGDNFLKKYGRILIIIGVIWFLSNLFGKRKKE